MGIAPIKMPQLGESVTEGTVDRWLKKEGDLVKRDEPIVEVVTDKVNAEIPSPYEGRLVRIGVTEGATVAIGTVLAEMEVEGAGTAPAGPAGPPAASTAAAGTAPAAPSVSAGDGRRARLSPAVRHLAAEHGIDPSLVPGTGAGGRVTREDVLAYVAGPAAAAATTAAPPAPVPPAAAISPAADGSGREELVRLSAMRRSIADHMTRSLATSPHAWTMQEVDVSALVAYREAEKEGFARRHSVRLTYLPFIAQVVAEALVEHPLLNSSWTDEGILVKHYVHLGIAVAVPDGLIVPVVHDADRLGFTDLVRVIDDLVVRARERRLKPEDVQGGTFTLNNTGATGSVASQPIINQPQAAILTTESILKRPVVIADGIAIRHMMNICMSFDHRVIDGQESGRFVNAIKQRLEAWTPASLRL